VPKIKTKSSLKKRFKKTATGKIKRSHAFTSHNFSSKTPKQKKKLRKSAILVKGDQKRIEQFL